MKMCFKITHLRLPPHPTRVSESKCSDTFGQLWGRNQRYVSISDKTCYCKISQSLETARFVFRIVRPLWNLTDTSEAMLQMCLSNFKSIRWFKLPISQLRDFTRSYDKTSFRILKQDPGWPRSGMRWLSMATTNVNVLFNRKLTCPCLSLANHRLRKQKQIRYFGSLSLVVAVGQTNFPAASTNTTMTISFEPISWSLFKAKSNKMRRVTQWWGEC